MLDWVLVLKYLFNLNVICMINATELKNGTTFQLRDVPYKVVKYRHQKIARGGGTVKLSLKNLKTGKKEEKTLNSSEKIEEISTIKKPFQYLYSDENTAYFMDQDNFNQVEIDTDLIEDEISFIKEGEQVDILFWDDKALSVNIPAKVTLFVKRTTPGIKGNSATNVFKSAILENDLEVKVPLFIEKGDMIVVDTRTAAYVERAK
jgi:elongation factor P